MTVNLMIATFDGEGFTQYACLLMVARANLVVCRAFGLSAVHRGAVIMGCLLGGWPLRKGILTPSGKCVLVS